MAKVPGQLPNVVDPADNAAPGLQGGLPEPWPVGGNQGNSGGYGRFMYKSGQQPAAGEAMEEVERPS